MAVQGRCLRSFLAPPAEGVVETAHLRALGLPRTVGQVAGAIA